MSNELKGEDLVIRVLTSLSKDTAGNMRKTMAAIAQDLALYVKRNKLSANPIHRRTGNLSHSITDRVQESSGEINAIVGTNAEYAKFLEYGTAPHLITPRNKMVLSFMIGGRRVFAKKVNHPGTKATHFMALSLSETRKLNVARIHKTMKDLLREQ